MPQAICTLRTSCKLLNSPSLGSIVREHLLELAQTTQESDRSRGAVRSLYLRILLVIQG